ncbi:hypothetical protein VrSk94_22120 [Vibrio rotiferianus]
MINKGLLIGSPFVLSVNLKRFPTRSFFTLGNDAVCSALSRKRIKNLILDRKLQRVIPASLSATWDLMAKRTEGLS